jgi:cell division initiation protein
MTHNPLDLELQSFSKRIWGYDPKEVQLYCRQMEDERLRLKAENSGLRRDLQEMEKEVREFKEREKSIRTILLNAQKTAEQLKTNAEKEAQLIVAEAELKAEKLLQGTHQRLTQLHEDIAELKRHRVQLETRLRATIETYQQLLNLDREDDKETEPNTKVKILNR